MVDRSANQEDTKYLNSKNLLVYFPRTGANKSCPTDPIEMVAKEADWCN